MDGPPLKKADSNLFEIAKSAIDDLHRWRSKNNRPEPPGFLWWDDGFTISGSSGTFASGKCSMCGPVFDTITTLHMDHCHQTGLYRGLLCRNCNLREGKMTSQWSLLWRLTAPNLAVGRRVIYRTERYTREFDQAELFSAPMGRLLRRANGFNIRDGRLTDVVYVG